MLNAKEGFHRLSALLPCPCPARSLVQPDTLHLVLRPFNIEQSRQFVSAALGGAQVRTALLS